jgi:hypothetical protein
LTQLATTATLRFVLTELVRLVGSLEFEEYGKIVLSRCETGADILTLTFRVEFDDSDEPLRPSSWTVKCEGYRRLRLQERVASSLYAVDDHVVVAACNARRYDLYFAGRPVNCYETVGRLVAAHGVAVQGWLPLSEFVKPAMALHDLFTTAGGFVARAPHRVAEHYLCALREGGLDAYLANESEPKRWDGFRWVPESERLSALILGNNYVVAERFTVAGGA